MARMDNKNSIISLENIDFGYDPYKPVFKSLNFNFIKGEKAALFGPNGCGKTTLFHIIMGLLMPSSGKINIFGKVRTSNSEFFEVRRRIGLLFQDSDDQLFSPTVAEDIAFGPLNLGKSRDEVKKIVSKTLNRLGLTGFEDRITYYLSGGEKRLVALGTILAMQPEVLLLDEPIIGLDENHQARFIETLKSIHSYIIISHDREFLDEVADHKYVLKNGAIA